MSTHSPDKDDALALSADAERSSSRDDLTRQLSWLGRIVVGLTPQAYKERVTNALWERHVANLAATRLRRVERMRMRLHNSTRPLSERDPREVFIRDRLPRLDMFEYVQINLPSEEAEDNIREVVIDLPGPIRRRLTLKIDVTDEATPMVIYLFMRDDHERELRAHKSFPLSDLEGYLTSTLGNDQAGSHELDQNVS